MIYTSYFAKATKLDLNKNAIICIARYIPKWVDKANMNHIISLAPSEQLLKDYKANKVTKEQYKEIYLKDLDDTLGINDIIDFFKQIEQESKDNGIDVVLCCYEAPDKFCHRHILREILENHIDIRELE